MTLTFLTLPLSTNNLYANVPGRGRVLTERGRRNKEDLGWEARSQFRGAPLTSALAVSVQLYWGDRRKHDIDNIKALLDACSGILWEDDGQIVDLHLTKAVAKDRPRVEMTIVPVTED